MAEEDSLQLARALQEEEDREAERQRKQKKEEDEASDAMVARLLNEQLNSTQQVSTGSANHLGYSQNRAVQPGFPTSGGKARFKSMRTGENIVVTLHHPETGSFIRERLCAKYLTTFEVRFELVNEPGKFLCVTQSGKVEFLRCSDTDPRSSFRFELTINDRVYLKCSAYVNSENIAGELGWFLSLLPNGRLSGNSRRSPDAQWSLVASNDQTEPIAQPTRSTTLGSALASFNPFSRRAETTEEAGPKATDDDGDDGLHLNPLLFPDTVSTNAPLVSARRGGPVSTAMNTAMKSAVNEPMESNKTSVGSNSKTFTAAMIRELPQFKAFISTLSPAISAAAQADPIGMIKAVQSAELWALLDSVPTDSLASTTEPPAPAPAPAPAPVPASPLVPASEGYDFMNSKSTDPPTYMNKVSSDIPSDVKEDSDDEIDKIRIRSSRRTPESTHLKSRAPVAMQMNEEFGFEGL